MPACGFALGGRIVEKLPARCDDRPGRPTSLRQGPERLGLYESVADNRGLNRASHDRQPAGIGCELAQKGVVDTASDDVDRLDPLF